MADEVLYETLEGGVRTGCVGAVQADEHLEARARRLRRALPARERRVERAPERGLVGATRHGEGDERLGHSALPPVRQARVTRAHAAAVCQRPSAAASAAFVPNLHAATVRNSPSCPRRA